MSGNGGGVPTVDGPIDGENCTNLIINTNISSPQALAIRNLTKGIILDVQAIGDQGPINFYNENGDLVGSVISRVMIRLLSCIVKGFEYEAEVLSITDGEVEVQIRSK